MSISLPRARHVLLCVGAILTSSVETTPVQAAQSPVLHLDFASIRGREVSDISGHWQNGVIHGSVTSVGAPDRKGIMLDGRTYVRVDPKVPLVGPKGITISTWAAGRGAPLRWTPGLRWVRSPYYQTLGDRVYLATNADLTPDAQKSTAQSLFPLLTATTDTLLSPWSYTNRTPAPLGGIEPKMQVTRDGIYYEYFGQDEHKVWQVYTARSNLDGTEWAATQQTHQVAGYTVEQDGNIQVYGGRLYLGFPRKGPDGIWQLITASTKRDGSDYREVAQTGSEAGGWIPTLQVYEGRVYYMFPTSPDAGPHKERSQYDVTMAVADLDGSHWRILRKVTHSGWTAVGGTGAFSVSAGRIHMVYPKEVDPATRWSSLYTASMNVDGSDFQETRRTAQPGFAGVSMGDMQIVGHRVYCTYLTIDTTRTGAETLAQHEKNGWSAPLDENYRRTYWTAQYELDGSQWTALARVSGPDDNASFNVPYRGVEVVGARVIYASNINIYSPGHPRSLQENLGAAGANLVNRGDSFGIGYTEGGSARAFVNAGDDYLYRSEAPRTIGGVTVDTPIDDRWHNVVMTYDRSTLSLYIDGQLKSSMPYEDAPGSNDFPLTIGTGFEGILAEVAVYDRPLSAAEVAGQR